MATLNVMQKKFVELYMSNGNNAKEACINAGYSEKNSSSIAHQLLQKEHIKQAIEECRTKIAEQIDIDVDWIQKELIENVKLAREAGKFTDSNTAIKMIGELIGAFQQNNDKGITINVLELLGNIKNDAEVIELEHKPAIMVEG